VEKRGNDFEVRQFGRGGGFCESYRWSARKTRKFICRHAEEPIKFNRP